MDPITTILTPAAILALVTITKDLGIPSKLAPVVAVVLGVALAVAEQSLGHLPAWQAGANGLLLGLAASGVYDVSKAAGTRQTVELTGDVVELDTGRPVGTYSRDVDLDAPDVRR